MQSESHRNELSRMLTVNEVAHLLHVHPSTVRRWEKQGQLKSYRLGPKGVIRFKMEDISKFINSTNKSQHEGGGGGLANIGFSAQTMRAKR